MSLTARPGGQIVWAENVINNSPTGGPNKEAYDSRYGTTGWVYAEHPPYQVFNEWNFNVYKNLDWLATAVIQNDAAIDVLGGGKYVNSALEVSGGGAVILFTTHGLSDPVIQLQDAGGGVVDADIIIDGAFNITIQNTVDGTYRIVVK